jgi:hypothetical protein
MRRLGFKHSKLLRSLGFLLAGNFFWLSATAPGVFSPDSIEVWRQIQFWDFNNWHPVAFTIWVWVTSCFGKSVFLAVIIQSLLLAGSLVLTFKLVFKEKPWSFAVFCGGTLQWTPFVGQMGVTLWKDIPYTAFLLLSVGVFGLNKSRLRIPLTIFFLSIGSSFRHDGIYLLCVLLFTLFIYSLWIKIKKVNGKSIGEYSKILVFGFLFTLIINEAIPVIMSAEPTQHFAKYGPLLQDLSAAQQLDSGGFSEAENVLISNMVSGDAAKGALDCERWDVMAMSPGVDYKLVNESGSTIPKTWTRVLFSKSGDTLIKAHFCRSKAFLPGLSIPKNWVWTYFALDSNSLNISRNAWGISNNVASRLDQAFNLFGRFLGWPGLYLNILIIGVYLLIKTPPKGQGAIWILIILGISRGIFNSLYTTGPYYRYGLITQLTAMVVLWFLVFRKISDYFKEKPRLGS